VTPQRVVLGAWVTLIALATVRGISQSKGLPAPSVYLGGAVLMTMLYGAAGFLGPLAAVTAVGVDVGVVMSPYLAGSSSAPLNTLAGWLSHLSPSAPAPGAGSTVTA
jgi:hypothetical protein